MMQFTEEQKKALLDEIEYNRKNCFLSSKTELLMKIAEAALKARPDDYFAKLVQEARRRADKAMRKFPQPNYVLNKVAEESGEVIKAVIHYTEGREDWLSVEGELIDNLAMLIRLVKEGDQVIGFTPPDIVKNLNAIPSPSDDL